MCWFVGVGGGGGCWGVCVGKGCMGVDLGLRMFWCEIVYVGMFACFFLHAFVFVGVCVRGRVVHLFIFFLRVILCMFASFEYMSYFVFSFHVWRTRAM